MSDPDDVAMDSSTPLAGGFFILHCLIQSKLANFMHFVGIWKSNIMRLTELSKPY